MTADLRIGEIAHEAANGGAVIKNVSVAEYDDGAACGAHRRVESYRFALWRSGSRRSVMPRAPKSATMRSVWSVEASDTTIISRRSLG